MTFFEKSLNTLELPAVLEMLSSQAVSASAKELCLHLLPATDRAEVARRLTETDDAKKLMVLKGSPAFSGLTDIRPLLNRAELGGTLSTGELLSIAALLRSARGTKAYFTEDNELETSLDSLFRAIYENRYLENKIFDSILSEDEIADNASKELADIRRKIRAASANARESLQKIISSPTYAKYLQEPIVTMRSDRFVVPVKVEFKGAIQGLVHDVSASGMTVFIEPAAAVKANNELRELAAKEKLEIERILAALSAECAGCAINLENDFSILLRLDFIFSKAKLSYKLQCERAVLSAGGVILKKARHPLLDPGKAVPISVDLGADYDTLIITGPNTGGKTVSLKTIGLLSAMNQCGLHIPASDGSELPVFSGILADIGDEQSIEQSLSTFSAHMNNIVNIISECDSESLVLFDELGAGTDPAEGAALAVSIIEHVREKGAFIAATTHYTELKVYATNEKGVQNASCEFDVETLRPTYRLMVGVPGKSNAFAISGRLGLDADIIEDAKTRIGVESSGFEATIEKLEETRLQLEKEREELSRKLRAAEDNSKKAAMLRAELEVRLEKADEKSRRDAERIISEARAAAEETFAQLDDMRSRINEEQEASEINAARNELRRKLNSADESLRKSTAIKPVEQKSSRPVKQGDTVLIKSMGTKAIVLSSDKGNLTLKAGIMTVNAREADVLLLENETVKVKKEPVRTGIQLRSESVSGEIDLRGMDSLEAVACAEQYIDNAVMGRISPIRIIHGKGTGVLRNAIHQMLKRNKAVKSYRLGVFGEGESGVTIVELK